MTLRSISRSLVILFILPLVMTLVACGSANELSPEPQTSDSSGAPMQVTTTGAAATQSASTQQPMQTPEAIEGGSTDDSRSSLQDLIIGSWVSIDRDTGTTFDELGFSFDGQFLYFDAVIGTYEVIGEHSVRITPNGNDESFSEPTIITIMNISPDSMHATGAMLDGLPMTRAKEVDNLARNVVGFWRVDNVVPESGDSSTPDMLFPIVRFDANGEFVPWLSYWTHGSYEVFNNSTVLVQAGDPSSPRQPFDPIFVEEIDGDTATVRFFNHLDPAFSYERLYQDKSAGKYLTGLWRIGDGTIEFTEDGRVIAASQEGRFFVFDDGTVLLQFPEMFLALDLTLKLLIESDDVAQLAPMEFDQSSLSFISDPENAYTLNRVK